MRTGRPPASSPEQRQRVYDLSDAGLSSRAVTAAVYGNPRWNNHVLRLLERRRRMMVEAATDQQLDEQLAAALKKLGD